MANKPLGQTLCFILRHRPEAFNVTVETDGGWANIDEIVENYNESAPIKISKEDILNEVKVDNKQRFSVSECGMKIRCNQGHSIEVDMGFPVVQPPDNLYHGTAEKSLVGIVAAGLETRGRQYVHLSDNIDTAEKVGARHGKAVIIGINAKAMVEDGHEFHLSDNGVWLTKHIPVKYLTIVERKRVKDLLNEDHCIRLSVSYNRYGGGSVATLFSGEDFDPIDTFFECSDDNNAGGCRLLFGLGLPFVTGYDPGALVEALLDFPTSLKKDEFVYKWYKLKEYINTDCWWLDERLDKAVKDINESWRKDFGNE